MAGEGSDPAGPAGAWATQDVTEAAGADPGDPGDPDDPATPPSSRVETGPGTPASGFGPATDSMALHRSRRRRRRQSITFAVFLLVVLGVGLLMLAAFQGRVTLPISDGKPVPLPTCGPAPAPTVQAFSDTSVHVFNASNRKGLALAVARDLQRRGFRVPSTPTNDPAKTQVTTLAVIRHGAKGGLAAHTLATVVAGPVTYQQDDRLGTDVDLVLGQTFALTPAPSGTGRPTAGGTPTAAAGGPAAGGAAAAASRTCEPASTP